MSVSKPPRQRMAPDQRRLQLKEAALQAFAARGYQATCVADIVNRAKVAQGTFYLYFTNKKALFLELMDDFGTRIQAAFDLPGMAGSVVSQRDPERIAAALEQGYRRYLELCLENLPLTRVFFQETVASDDDLRRKRQQILEALAAQARWYLERGIKRGLLRTLDAEVAAYCIVGMIERVTIQWLLVQEDPQLDLLSRELARFEALGITTRSTRRRRG